MGTFDWAVHNSEIYNEKCSQQCIHYHITYIHQEVQCDMMICRISVILRILVGGEAFSEGGYEEEEEEKQEEEEEGEGGKGAGGGGGG